MAWEITGNNGTNPNPPNSNFLGTIDKQPLAIRTNGTERLRVDENGNVGIGVNNPGMPLDVQGRTRLRDGIGGPAAGPAGLWLNTAHDGSGGVADIGFIGVVDATRIGLYGNDPRGGSLPLQYDRERQLVLSSFYLIDLRGSPADH